MMVGQRQISSTSVHMCCILFSQSGMFDPFSLINSECKESYKDKSGIVSRY